jgi:hypothetical protein
MSLGPFAPLHIRYESLVRIYIYIYIYKNRSICENAWNIISKGKTDHTLLQFPHDPQKRESSFIKNMYKNVEIYLTVLQEKNRHSSHVHPFHFPEEHLQNQQFSK